MQNSFIIGLALGMIGGALIITNCKEARKMVKDGQHEIKQKVEKMQKQKSRQDSYDEYD